MQQDDSVHSDIPSRWLVFASGCGCLTAWILTVFFTGVSLPPDVNMPFVAGEYSRCIGLISFAVFMVLGLIVARKPRRLSDKRLGITLSVLGVVPYVYTLLVVYLVPEMIVISCACWVVEGYVAAGMMFVWSSSYCAIPYKLVVVVPAISFIVAGILFVIGCNLPFPLEDIFSYLLLAFSVVSMLAFCGEQMPTGGVEGNLRIEPHTSVLLVIVGACMGYLFFRVVVSHPDLACYLFGLGLIIGAAFAIISSRRIGQTMLLIAPSMRFVNPVLIAGFVILPILSTNAQIVCVAVMLVAASCMWLSLISNTCALASHFAVKPSYHWMRTNAPWIGGLALGALMGLVVENGLLAFVPISVESVFIIALAIAVSVAPFGLDALTDPKSFEEDVSDVARRRLNPWRTACEELEVENHLTEREWEVFRLLVKGRSYSIIARELMISVHTVKTHIGNIYFKLGVNNQQELIDVVEKRCAVNRAEGGFIQDEGR